MRRRTFLASTACFAAATLAGAGATLANTDMRVSGPFAHENLAVYFLHGASSSGPVPLTLAEALAKGSASVLETGRVSELVVENTGTEELFIQAGDIVKGGQQDRVLTVSLLVPPKSGRIPIASFCVEQGRWTARGREDVAKFASATEALPSREAKLAMKQAASGEPPAARVRRTPAEAFQAQGRVAADPTGRLEQRQSAGGDGQSEIWRSVAETQRKLSSNLKSAVASAHSATSLQLSLENEKVVAERTAYVTALQGKGEAESDIIGVVIAVNGRLNSAEAYPSNGLFRKMWGKVLTAAATEALGERHAANEPAPAPSAAKEFLQVAEAGKAQSRELPAKAKLETRSSDKALFSAAYGTLGQVIHRSYVAK